MTTQRPWPQRRRLQDGQLAELSIVNCESGESTVIYETAELIEAPNWTPDGEWLIFNADCRIFRISRDGKRGPERINTEPIKDLNNDPASSLRKQNHSILQVFESLFLEKELPLELTAWATCRTVTFVFLYNAIYNQILVWNELVG